MLRDALIDARRALLTAARRCDEWAKESRTGGWSTHQVEANIALANDLRRKVDAIDQAIEADDEERRQNLKCPHLVNHRIEHKHDGKARSIVCIAPRNFYDFQPWPNGNIPSNRRRRGKDKPGSS